MLFSAFMLTPHAFYIEIKAKNNNTHALAVIRTGMRTTFLEPERECGACASRTTEILTALGLVTRERHLGRKIPVVLMKIARCLFSFSCQIDSSFLQVFVA
jgi:hypothetical protein